MASRKNVTVSRERSTGEAVPYALKVISQEGGKCGKKEIHRRCRGQKRKRENA